MEKDSDSNTCILSHKISLNHITLDTNTVWNQVGIIFTK